jgi:hypothetical protein
MTHVMEPAARLTYFCAMRFWAFLVALMVALSAMVPAYTLPRHEAHDCCAKNSKPAGHTPKKSGADCCNDGFCNPFVHCSCCAFLIQKGVSIRTEISFQAVADYQRPRDASLRPSFVGSCFHPPEPQAG